MAGRSEAFERFMASTDIGYEQWHDGVGYDLEALALLDGHERADAARFLLHRAGDDWRDLEALLALGTPEARAVVIRQLREGALDQRLWAARYLGGDPDLAQAREDATIAGIREAGIGTGLRVALDLANEIRTPAVVDALFRATLADELDMSIHAAALLAFVHGKAKEDFDWELRPLFLRFGTPDRTERELAFRELCALCGVDPEPFLREWR